MATDYAEKERVFVSELKADTGRNLDEWMLAINKANLPHRNDIIDWLRQQGFTFANASWLERIHANNGRLIYAGDLPPPERQQARFAKPTESPAETDEPPSPRRAPPPAPPPAAKIIAFPPAARSPAPEAPAQTSRASQATPDLTLDADVETALAAAKGLRPLAIFAIGEILRILPESRITAEGPLIILSSPRRYLAIFPGPKELRLYGDFAGSGDGRVSKAEPALKLPGKPPPPFPAVLTLADARLVDTTFAAIVKTAVRRAHA